MHFESHYWQDQFFNFIDGKAGPPPAPPVFPYRGIVGRTPLGYQTIRSSEGFIIQQDPDVAPFVKEAFRQLSLPDARPLTVWREIAASGLRGATGKPLLYRPFRHTMLSPFYIGLIHHRGELYQGTYPPLVDLETWKEVRQKILGSEERWREDDARRHELRNKFIFHNS